MLKDLVALVDNGDLAKGFVNQAISLAQAQNAHLTVTMLNDLFAEPAMMTPYDAYIGVIEELEAEQARREQDLARVVETSGAEVEIRTVTETPGYLAGAARVEGRYADLLIVGDPASYVNPKLRNRSVEAALMGSGGPVLILPQDFGLQKVCHVVLGWDASGEARRAAKDLLQIAEPGAHIDIVLVDPEPSTSGHGASPGSDIARHLARHGFGVAVHREASAGADISDVLQEFTVRNAANLLAVGAYAHSRVREIFLGGVTKNLLQNASIPVLLSR